MTTNNRNPRISPELLIRRDDIALVYLTDDKKFNVRYKLGQATVLTPECEAFLAKANIAETASTNFLSVDSRQLWKRMLGEAIALAIGGNLASAHQIEARAEEFLRDRAVESAHMWYVQACLMLIVVLVIAYAFFDYTFQYRGPKRTQSNIATKSIVDSSNSSVPGAQSTGESKDASRSSDDTNRAAGDSAIETQYRLDEDDIYTIKYLMIALIAGAVGAGFSVLVRIGRLTVDPASGRMAHYGEVLFRMTIGALAGAIIIIGWQADVFATFLKADRTALDGTIMRASQSSFQLEFWKLTILAIVAGASERLVPSLLKQFSDQTEAETPAPDQNSAT